MPKSRKSQVSIEATPHYHCVRRAFLCGVDNFTGRNFEYRRQWIEDRLLELSQIFAIDVAAFSIMTVFSPAKTAYIIHVNIESLPRRFAYR